MRKWRETIQIVDPIQFNFDPVYFRIWCVVYHKDIYGKPIWSDSVGFHAEQVTHSQISFLFLSLPILVL